MNNMLPASVQHLVRHLSKLPGVGEKTAQRFALFLATRELDTARALGDAMHTMADRVSRCTRCGGIAERDDSDLPALCDICRDTRRDGSQLCVVARIQDLLSIEKSGAYRGYYFVLGALLSPLEGISAEELPLRALAERIEQATPAVGEVVVATPPSVDGEATALLLAQTLRAHDLQVTRIASGVPHGGDLEYSDPITIGRALAGRRDLD